MVQWDSVEQLEQYQLHQRNDLPKLGTDSKLLAQFATLHRREKVLDLGCGVGVLGVLLAQRQKELTLDGIDIVPESAELAAYNLTANGLTGTIRQGDLNHCRQWAPRPGGVRTAYRTVYLRGLFGDEQKKPPDAFAVPGGGGAHHDLLRSPS